MKKASKPMRGLPLLKAIAAAATDKKAEEITVLNLNSESGIADWFIICQGDNAIHNRAIADNIEAELGARGVSPWHIEGGTSPGVSGAFSGTRKGTASGVSGAWIVLDFSDVIVHVMTPQVRKYYDLEELWKPVDMKDIENKFHE
jgi:ribosome-associated protein